MNRLLRLFRRRAVESEMREEMEFHREARKADLIARGMAPDKAERTARMEFGSVDKYEEESRVSLGYRPWDELCSDLRFALRSVRNHPGYSAAAIAILGLAIGANTAFFTLYSHHLLRPLPIKGAERHFDLRSRNERGIRAGGFTRGEIETLRQAGRPYIEGIYSLWTIQVLLLEPTQRHSLVSAVSGNYFRLLGARPAIGQVFSEADEREPVAVLSHAGRLQLFPDDATPIGRKVRIRGTVFTVIGVLAPEFTGTEPAVPDFWVSASMRRALPGGEPDEEPRFNLSGLLAPGVALQTAEAALTGVAAGFPRQTESRIARIELKPHVSSMGENEEIEIAASFVFAAFLLVLLIACANLANLCLARAAARTHEIAMRLSLGASRARILRQLLTESTFLAILGSVAGLGVAAIVVEQVQSQLVAFLGGLGIRLLPVSLDWRVFVFSAVLGLLAGISFGLLPAIEITSPSLSVSSKRENSVFAGRVRPRQLRDTLIAAQVAASLVLLLLASVLVLNSRRLYAISPGYDLDRIYDLRVDGPKPELLDQIGRQPEVASITAVMQVPLYGPPDRLPAIAGGRTLSIAFNIVDERYFDTMALPVDGRMFSHQEAATNARVTVISHAMARDLFPGASPVGQTLTITSSDASDPVAPGPYQVIGVAPDVINGLLFSGIERNRVYFPGAAGQPAVGSAVVRFRERAASTVGNLRRLCASEKDGAGCEPSPLRKVASMQLFPFQIAAAISGGLGVLALILTSVGLYSVTSYTVVQRRREIGIRMALGASAEQVLRRLLKEAWWCVTIGLATGLPVCLLLSKLAESSVFNFHSFDLASYTVVPALLAVITTIACAVPARRAARVDPMKSLREE